MIFLFNIKIRKGKSNSFSVSSFAFKRQNEFSQFSTMDPLSWHENFRTDIKLYLWHLSFVFRSAVIKLLNTWCLLHLPSTFRTNHACVLIATCLTHLFTTCIFNKHSVEKDFRECYRAIYACKNAFFLSSGFSWCRTTYLALPLSVTSLSVINYKDLYALLL